VEDHLGETFDITATIPCLTVCQRLTITVNLSAVISKSHKDVNYCSVKNTLSYKNAYFQQEKNHSLLFLITIHIIHISHIKVLVLDMEWLFYYMNILKLVFKELSNWNFTITTSNNKKAQLTLTNPRDAKGCKNCSNSTCFISFHRIPFPQISNYQCIASRGMFRL